MKGRRMPSLPSTCITETSRTRSQRGIAVGRRSPPHRAPPRLQRRTCPAASASPAPRTGHRATAPSRQRPTGRQCHTAPASSESPNCTADGTRCLRIQQSASTPRQRERLALPPRLPLMTAAPTTKNQRTCPSHLASATGTTRAETTSGRRRTRTSLFFGRFASAYLNMSELGVGSGQCLASPTMRMAMGGGRGHSKLCGGGGRGS